MYCVPPFTFESTPCGQGVQCHANYMILITGVESNLVFFSKIINTYKVDFSVYLVISIFLSLGTFAIPIPFLYFHLSYIISKKQFFVQS